MTVNARNTVCFILVFTLLLLVFSSVLVLTTFAMEEEVEVEYVYEIPQFRGARKSSSTRAAVSEYVTLPVGTTIIDQPTLFLGTSNLGDYKANSNVANTYVFAYPRSDNAGEYNFCFVNTSTFRVNSGITGNYTPSSDAPLNPVYNVYYALTSLSLTFSSVNVPIYGSAGEGLADIGQYLGVYTPPSEFEYTLPPGNVAYIPIPRGQTQNISYTLTTTYYMAFGNNDTSRINQVVTVMSTLPSSTNNLAPSSPIIPWTNNGNVNLLGISANKIYQGTIPVSYGGQFLVVVNPMTMPSQSGLIGGDTYTNGSINISVSAAQGSPYIYPMSEALTITPGNGIGSESSYGDSGYTYEIDPETGEIIWSDPYGGNEAPVAGGNNPMPTPNTIFDWLRNISQQLSDFLRGPVQAVQVVVGAIRDFMGSFTQLYQWLPSPVYSLITSALMIALTIGVIKIFV